VTRPPERVSRRRWCCASRCRVRRASHSPPPLRCCRASFSSFAGCPARSEMLVPSDLALRAHKPRYGRPLRGSSGNAKAALRALEAGGFDLVLARHRDGGPSGHPRYRLTAAPPKPVRNSRSRGSPMARPISLRRSRCEPAAPRSDGKVVRFAEPAKRGIGGASLSSRLKPRSIAHRGRWQRPGNRLVNPPRSTTILDPPMRQRKRMPKSFGTPP
jgi:hypothetical protein